MIDASKTTRIRPQNTWIKQVGLANTMAISTFEDYGTGEPGSIPEDGQEDDEQIVRVRVRLPRRLDLSR